MPNITDGPPSARRGRNVPEIDERSGRFADLLKAGHSYEDARQIVGGDPADHPDVVAHKRAVLARLQREATDAEAKAALRGAVAVSLKAKLAAFTGPERDLLLERLIHAGGIPSNILGELRDLGAP